jgi:uncharacterized protein YhhL (DUF1145 family)|tara:strand:+ start:521 stop:790 length:270 start_codon:yes stop_codon:yes gene_type:complete
MFLMGLLRGVIVVFWVAVGLAIFLDLPSPFDRLLLGAGLVVAVLHALECIGFMVWIRRRGLFHWRDALMIMIFGVAYLKPRMRTLRHTV